MNAIIACGGTGGHLFPGIAVAEVLRARGHEVMLFVSEKEIDSLALAGHSELRFEKLPTIGLPSPFSPTIFRFTQRFNESLSLSRRIYRAFKPHIVLGMGGFTSTAPILAGRMRGVPTLIHESNAIPGKANRLTARLVRAVLLGFADCAKFFPKVRTEVTGTPLRGELRRIDRAEARRKLGLRQDLRTILIMGGSQGATGINQAILKALPMLNGQEFQVIHLSGARDERLMADNYQRENIPAYVAAFHHSMEEVYSAADFAIARSGAASLSELAAFGLPSLLIPFPYAADDHQTRNAEIFVKADAAMMVREAELTGDAMARKLREMIADAGRLQRMSENSARLAPKNAAALVADTMEKYIQADAARA
ncbi:MAG: undecaprenyldiphospho-muramoylpentapeptide beta-N-acetylglucosaminyltransferase [Verrucomicrobiota bacterium]|nr:undecaprenyldiphospho-muramoylpentapeptide beta-N-acetylglucosaminyltransferase [Verrucomicrobiota bacterium]